MLLLLSLLMSLLLLLLLLLPLSFLPPLPATFRFVAPFVLLRLPRLACALQADTAADAFEALFVEVRTLLRVPARWMLVFCPGSISNAMPWLL